MKKLKGLKLYSAILIILLFVAFGVTQINVFVSPEFVAKVQAVLGVHDFVPTGVWDFSSATTTGLPASTEATYFDFDTTYSGAMTKSGRVAWNEYEQTLDIVTGSGSVIVQVGQETMTKIFNNTGAEIVDGKVINTTGVIIHRLPEVELSNNTSLLTAQAFIGVATQNIADGDSGFATVYGKVRGINLSGFSNGRIYVGINGNFTNIRPVFPAYELVIGGIVDNSVDGILIVNIKYDHYDTFTNIYNGIIRETLDFFVGSNGTIITGILEKTGGGDLTIIFSSGFDTLDCTPIQTIQLIPGTDTSPQINYIYVLKSTGLLTVSTSDWPATEHAKIANVVLKSVLTTQKLGALVNRNWNDHIQDTVGMGDHAHIGEWIRNRAASWYSGCAGTMTVGTNAAALDSLFFSNTGGKVFQKHLHTFTANNMQNFGKAIIVINNFVTAYDTTSNFNTQLIDANNVSMSGNYYWLVIGGINNKNGDVDQIFGNLPTSSYANDVGGKATYDEEQTSVFAIPPMFKGVGFLIGRYLIQHIAAGNGTFIIHESEDLRGLFPSTTAGGGGSGATEFTGLNDTPSSYSGEAGKIPVVNVGETGLEFTDDIVNKSDSLVIFTTSTQVSDSLDAVRTYITQTSIITKIIIVDGNRTDSYIADGTKARPYKTIQAAITAASSPSVLIIEPGTYNENLILKPGVHLKGKISNSFYGSVVITGKVTYSSGAGSVELFGIHVLNVSDHAVELLGTDAQKLFCYNCKFETNSSGVHHVLVATNTNASSEFFLRNGLLQVQNSSGAAKCIDTDATSALTIGLQNTTVRITDDTDKVAVDLDGSVNYWHTLDSIEGRVTVASTASVTISLCKITSATQSVLTTNSAGTTVLMSVTITATASPAVTGAGVFAYNGVYYASTGRGFASTLNGGFGAGVGALPFDSITLFSVDGLDYTPGSDTDVDLITVNVTDTPKFWWNETDSRFEMDKSLGGTVFFLKEQAAADADDAGYMQLWAKNTTPTELWITDDVGTDTQLGVAGGSPLEVEDEGVSLDAAVTKLNFLGAGVSAVENADHEIDITIAGGGGAADTVAVGELTKRNGTSQTITLSASTWTRIDMWSNTETFINTSYDGTNKGIKVDYAGLYEVTWCVSAEAANTGTGVNQYIWCIGTDAARLDRGNQRTDLDTAAGFAAITVATCIDMTAEDTICVWVYNATDADNVTINGGSLLVERITYSR